MSAPSRFLRKVIVGLALLALPGRAPLALAGEGEGHGGGDGGGAGGGGSGGSGSSSGGTGAGGHSGAGGEDGAVDGQGAGQPAAASAPAGSLGSIFRGDDASPKDRESKDGSEDKKKTAALGAEQAQAREAVKRGEIKPFEAIKRKVEGAVAGSVLKVSLTHPTQTAWTYSIVVLTADGQYRKVQVDAAANRILEVR